MKAYRQDFAAIAFLVTDGDPARLTVADITKDSMRHAFAAYARDHEAASGRLPGSGLRPAKPAEDRRSQFGDRANLGPTSNSKT